MTANALLQTRQPGAYRKKTEVAYSTESFKSGGKPSGWVYDGSYCTNDMEAWGVFNQFESIYR